MKQYKITNVKLFVTRVILIILVLAVIMLSVLFFSGCSATSAKNDDATEKLGFEQITSYYDYDEGITYTYLCEKLTNVVYLMIEEDAGMSGYDGTSGITVMINPNTGGPMMREEFIKYVEDSKA